MQWLLCVLFILIVGIDPSVAGLSSQVCKEHYCIDVEIALTPQELQHGLMGRTSLDKSKGMLFVFTDIAVHHFWMKNTRIPLDMLWIDATGRIVDIISDVQPCIDGKYCPSQRPKNVAKYVLEINAGISKTNGLKEGDLLTLPTMINVAN